MGDSQELKPVPVKVNPAPLAKLVPVSKAKHVKDAVDRTSSAWKKADEFAAKASESPDPDTLAAAARLYRKAGDDTNARAMMELARSYGFRKAPAKDAFPDLPVGGSVRMNSQAARAYDSVVKGKDSEGFKPGDKVTTDVTPQVGVVLSVDGSGDMAKVLIRFGKPNKYGVSDVRRLYAHLLRKAG